MVLKGRDEDMERLPIQPSCLDMDATSLAQAIREGQLSSTEVVHTYIEQIKKVNPHVNAVVENRFTSALEEAKQADQEIHTHQEIGPLHGVPISIKEAFHVKNMKTTGGISHRKDLIFTQDAHVVATLKAAGAIIIGKTNTPTLCFCQETDNKLYGRTNNPWDLTRTAGGSSGGEGALIVAGGSVAGIGSDIGGSIRFPSHFNGVIGFKSGKFQVNPTGHFPADTLPLQSRMLSIGPMGKSVRDIALLYGLMANEVPLPLSLEKVQIDILANDSSYPLSKRTAELLDDLHAELSGPFTTQRTIPPYFHDSAQLWQEIMSVDGGESMKKLAFNKDRSHPLAAYIKEKVTNKTNTHTYLSWALIGAKLFQPSEKRIRDITTILDQGDNVLKDYLHNKLLIFPVYHEAAGKHGHVYQEIFSIRKTYRTYMPYVAYANVWGLPALTIPIGVDEQGLPISIQIMANTGNEDLIFQVATRIEKKFRGYVRSLMIDPTISHT